MQIRHQPLSMSVTRNPAPTATLSLHRNRSKNFDIGAFVTQNTLQMAASDSGHSWKKVLITFLALVFALAFLFYGVDANLFLGQLTGGSGSGTKGTYSCSGPGHAMECALGTCPDGQQCVSNLSRTGKLVCECTKKTQTVTCCEYGEGDSATHRCEIGGNCRGVGTIVSGHDSYGACQGACDPDPPDAVYCCNIGGDYSCSNECPEGTKVGIHRDVAACGIVCKTGKPPYDDWCSEMQGAGANACRAGLCVGATVENVNPTCGTTTDPNNPSNCECKDIPRSTVNCCTNDVDPNVKVCAKACPPGFSRTDTKEYKSINEAWDWCRETCQGTLPGENVCCKVDGQAAFCTTASNCPGDVALTGNGIQCAEKCGKTIFPAGTDIDDIRVDKR